MEFIINDEIKMHPAGVYKIQFDNGYFYIGSSINLYDRIKTHCNDIKNGCKVNVSLRKMSGFDGTVTFSLLESIDTPVERRSKLQRMVADLEYTKIKENSSNKMLINNPRYGIGRVSINGTVMPETKSEIYRLAKEKGVSANSIVQDLIELALKTYK